MVKHFISKSDFDRTYTGIISAVNKDGYTVKYNGTDTNVKTTATKENIEPKEITKEQFTIPQKICAIKDMLISRKRIMFSELFINSLNRNEVITTFLAVLELLKAQTIKVKQNEEFGDIEIAGVENENNG